MPYVWGDYFANVAYLLLVTPNCHLQLNSFAQYDTGRSGVFYCTNRLEWENSIWYKLIMYSGEVWGRIASTTVAYTLVLFAVPLGDATRLDSRPRALGIGCGGSQLAK